VVNDADFLGLICDTDIYNMDSFDESIENYHISLDRSYVIENQHVSDVIRAFGSGKLTLLPVLNEKKQYLGVITLAHLVQSLASVLPVSNPGGVLVLEINEKDYVLTEIAQIVESNDAKILFMYIRSFPDSTKLEVTLKINRIDTAAVIQTFNRYNYIIKASFSEDTYSETMKDRFDSLMKYLNV
ncbi:MAG: CBS domain-containing protein, partial [Bacteroidota bacterium]|nr:CBS domain-containing protein [Bacteroidota bacterium]